MPVPFEIVAASEIHGEYIEARTRQDKKKMEEAEFAMDQLIKSVNYEDVRAKAAASRQKTEQDAQLHPGIVQKGESDAKKAEAEADKLIANLPAEEAEAKIRSLTAAAILKAISTPEGIAGAIATEEFERLVRLYESIIKHDIERKKIELGAGTTEAETSVKETKARGGTATKTIQETDFETGKTPEDAKLTPAQEETRARIKRATADADSARSEADRTIRENDFEKAVVALSPNRAETEAKIRAFKAKSSILLSNIQINAETLEFEGIWEIDPETKLRFLNRNASVPGDMIEFVKPIAAHTATLDAQAFKESIETRKADQADLDRALKAQIARATENSAMVTAALKENADEFAQATVIRKELAKWSEPFLEIRSSYDAVLAGFNLVDDNGNPSPVGTVSMIMGLMKVLDPKSVVRESEYDRLLDLGDLGQRVSMIHRKFLKGELVHEDVRQDIMDIAQQLYDKSLAYQLRFEEGYREKAKIANIDWRLVSLEALSDKEADKQLRDTSGAFQYYEQKYRFRHDWGRIKDETQRVMAQYLRLEGESVGDPNNPDLIKEKTWEEFVSDESGDIINNEQRLLIYKQIDQFVMIRDGMIAYQANHPDIRFGKDGLDMDVEIEQELIEWMRKARASEVATIDEKAFEAAINRVMQNAMGEQ